MSMHTARTQASRIRWRIFSLLFGFGFIAYLQQKCITVAAARMMPELRLSQLQIGWLEWGFVLGYGLLQLPAGFIGQRLGARVAFVVVGVAGFLATAATPLAPYLLVGSGLFIVLLALQLVLGFAQAAIFPVSAGVFQAWFPRSRWAFVQGLQTMGLSLGAALAPPLIATLMSQVGWQRALLWTSVPAVGLVLVWAWYGRDTPRAHPAVSASELEELGHDLAPSVDRDIDIHQLFGLLADRSVVLLAVAYLLMNYSFYLLSNWVFLYLVQERHFSVLESGWLASAPPLAAAAGAGVGGLLTGRLCRRVGDRWGFRLMPLLALPVASALLLISIGASNPYWAVLALAACFASVELCEGAFWGAAMTIGSGDTMAVSAVMNTGGVLGGIIGIPIVAYLSGRHLWHAAFVLGAGLAMTSALTWLGIDVEPTKAAHGKTDAAVTQRERVVG